MNVLKWAIILVIAGFLIMLGIGASVSPEDRRRHTTEAEVERVCDQMMSDAAPGTDRRLTRQMCEQAKARAGQPDEFHTPPKVHSETYPPPSAQAASALR